MARNDTLFGASRVPENDDFLRIAKSFAGMDHVTKALEIVKGANVKATGRILTLSIRFSLVLTVLAVISGGEVLASTVVALKRNTKVIRKGDVVYPKLGLTFAPGETRKDLENSTFSIALNNPSQDRCEIRVSQGDTSRSRVVGHLKVVRNLRVESLQPRFEVEKFISDFKAYVPRIFSEMITSDSAEGVVFRRDELKMEMNSILASDPMRQVPKGFRSRLEQSLVTHLWGCYGDLMKFKDRAGSRLSQFRQLWTNRLVSDVESGLRKETRKKAVGSDQLAKTRVVLDLKHAHAGAGADPELTVDCIFEGPTHAFTLDRLNSVLSPYLEIIPRREYQDLFKRNSLPMREIRRDKSDMI